MGIFNLTGKLLKCVKQSALPEHLLDCNYSKKIVNSDTLASDGNKFRLLIKESLFIELKESLAVLITDQIWAKNTKIRYREYTTWVNENVYQV